MDIEEIRKNSYIYKMFVHHRGEFIRFLSENGYLPKIVYNKYTDEASKPFELGYSRDLKKYELMVRCQRTTTDDEERLQKYLLKAHTFPAVFAGMLLDNSTENIIIYLSDFGISVFPEDVDKAKEFRTNYLKFMYKLFGEQYKKELDAFYKRPHDKELGK